MDKIRVVAFMEAMTVTGPAGNLIRFARCARENHEGMPPVELSVATFRRSGGSSRFLDALRNAGIDVDLIPERSRFDFSSLRRIAEVVRRRRPDIIQTHAVKSHFLLRLSGLRREYPWIAFHHGYTAEDFKMKLYNRLDRFSLPAADNVVTVCEPFADELSCAAVTRERIRILPNSIDPVEPAAADAVQALRVELGLVPDERVILSIGRFSREKAQVDLVPAIVWLRRNAPGLRFRVVLVGDGGERGRVVGAVAAAGVSENFLFAGFRSDVSAFYGLADVFALPSHSEGSPNVLLEAMAFGVPIVATSVGGVPETVDDNVTALLVPSGNAELLGAALRRLLTEPELASAFASAGREAVRRRFSPEAYRQRLVAVYLRARDRFGIRAVPPSS